MSEATLLPLRAQLTYTSLESSSGGGWQVKEERGRILEEDLQTILGRIPTRLPAPQAGRFVTASEASAWPRRLTHQLLRPPSGELFQALVHSVSAGQDRSGRSGNVFSHCALPVAGSGKYPIQAWQSPSWLTPFGPEAVQAAALREDGLQLSSMLADEVAVFLAEDENDKLQVLAVLLDGVHAALMNRGPTVALVVQDTQEAAAWIQAVSMCMSTRTAAGFVFSTCEAIGASESWAAEGFHVVCLLPDAHEALNKIEDVAVLDASSPVELGVRDADPHRTARGDQVTATIWSELMFETMAAFSDLRDFSSAMAELEHQIPGEDSSDPSWWMAMVLYSRGSTDQPRQVVDVVARLAPSGVAVRDDILETVRGALLTTMGNTTAECFTKLLSMVDIGLTPYMQRLATAAYVDAACKDPAWLVDAERVIPPAIDDVPLTHEMEATIADLPHATDLSVTDRAIAGVRFLELTRTLGWGEDRGIAAPLEALNEQWIAPAVSDGMLFRSLLKKMPHLHPNTLQTLREHAFSQAHERQLDGDVLEGLQLLEPQGNFDPLCYEEGDVVSALGMQVIRETWLRARTAEEKKPIASSVVWGASQAMGTGAFDAPEWRAMETDIRLEPSELRPIVKRWRKSVSPDVVMTSMLAARPDVPELKGLMTTVINQGSSGHQVRELAESLEVLRGERWKHSSILRDVWDIIRLTYKAADDRNLPVPVQYRQAMKLMAICAIVAWPMFLPQPKELNRLVQTTVPNALIEEAIPLFVGSLPNPESHLKSIFPYMVHQDLLIEVPSRTLLLGMSDRESGLSEVERFIKASLEQKQVAEEALLRDLKEWVDSVVSAGPLEGKERWAREIEKSVLSWFRKNVRTKDGLGTRLWKGLTR